MPALSSSMSAILVICEQSSSCDSRSKNSVDGDDKVENHDDVSVRKQQCEMRRT